MGIISKDLGPVTAYAAAVNRGYTGTREEFETLMASYATVAEQAGESASQAAGSANDAESSATAAAASASNASGSASAAATSAGNASSSATAAQSAQTAAESARDAAQTAQSAAEAAQANAEATASSFDTTVTEAISDVNTAGTNQKELAKRQAEKSEAWAVGKINGEDVGVSDPAYHNNAKYYSEQISESAATASTKASEAAESATNAAQSAAAAAQSAQSLVIDDTLSEEGQAAGAKAVGDAIDSVKKYLQYQKTSSHDISLWESGAIAPGDGSLQNTNTRLRVKNYLDKSIKACMAEDGFTFVVFAWDQDDQYIGCCRPDYTFAKIGSAYFTSFDFSRFSETGYSFKIVGRNTASTAISASDAINFIFTKETTAIDKLPYGLSLNGRVLSIVGADGAASNVTLPENSESEVTLSDSKNLGFAWEINGINLDTGEDQTISTRKRSQYVPVEEGKTYAFNVAEFNNSYAEYVFYYDENKNPILIDTDNNRYYTRMASGLFPKTLTIPTGYGISYIRMMVGTVNFDTYHGQAEENITSTSYRNPEAFHLENAKLPNNVSGYLGKNVLLLGDSITAQNNWSEFFKASVKPANLYNYAVGGSMWCDPESGIVYDGTSGTYNVIGNQTQRAINNHLADLDCIIIFAGTNDTNVSFPSDEDIETAFFDASMNPIALSDVDKTTWQGAMRWTIETLILQYPNAKIFVCSPVQRVYKSAEPILSLYSTIKGKGETIQKMAKRMGVEFIDTEQCGISACRSLYFADGLHPWKRSSEKIARYIIARYMAWFCQD